MIVERKPHVTYNHTRSAICGALYWWSPLRNWTFIIFSPKKYTVNRYFINAIDYNNYLMISIGNNTYFQWILDKMPLFSTAHAGSVMAQQTMNSSQDGSWKRNFANRGSQSVPWCHVWRKYAKSDSEIWWNCRSGNTYSKYGLNSFFEFWSNFAS